MHSRTQSFLRTAGKGALLTPLLWLSVPGQAQTTGATVTTSTTTTTVTTDSAILKAQQAAAQREFPVTPNLRVHNATGLKAAVISATDTDANLLHARRALLAANVALARTPEYALMPVADIAGFLKDQKLSYPYSIEDYQKLDKKGKIKRALMVTVGPGTSDANSSSHTAIVEMFDTASGGLVGRGQGAFMATVANTAVINGDAATDATETEPYIPTAEELELRAIDGAVFAAVDDMMQPAQLNGVVVTRPNGYQARLSLGEISGLRNGSQIEYIGAGGQPVAYGTVISIGRGEALATIAPERALPSVHVNMPFRTLSIPSAGRAGPTQSQLDDREWNRFERDFGISAVIAGAIYLLVR